MAEDLDNPLLSSSNPHLDPPHTDSFSYIELLTLLSYNLFQRILFFVLLLIMSLVLVATLNLIAPPEIVSASISSFNISKQSLFLESEITWDVTLSLDKDVSDFRYDATAYLYMYYEAVDVQRINSPLSNADSSLHKKVHMGSNFTTLMYFSKNSKTFLVYDRPFNLTSGIPVFDMLVDANATYNYGSWPRRSRSELFTIECNDLKVEFSEEMRNQRFDDVTSTLWKFESY